MPPLRVEDTHAAATRRRHISRRYASKTHMPPLRVEDANEKCQIMSNDIWKMIPSTLVAALLVSLVVAACNKPTELSSVVTIEHEITPQPVRVGPATLQLRLADASRQPVTGASITLEGNMSHAGMSPVFAQARETEPGRYQAIVDLAMAGDWTILTHVTLAGGQQLERQFDVKGVRAN
jgi:hypothetical protein